MLFQLNTVSLQSANHNGAAVDAAVIEVRASWVVSILHFFVAAAAHAC